MRNTLSARRTDAAKLKSLPLFLRKRKALELFIAGGGALCAALGLLLLRICETTNQSAAALQPLGLGLIFIAVLTVSVAANLLDKNND